MLTSILLSAVLQAQEGATSSLESLAAARGAYETNYVSPKTEKFKALERIGTNNLGNPIREWYFPSGSASSRVWIINWYGDTGALVKQSRHGKQTKTDWVLDLRYDPLNFGPKPKGTLALILWNLGYEVAEQTTKEQSALLDASQGYSGYMYSRGPVDDDVYAWYVYADGRLRPYYGAYAPRSVESDGGFSADPAAFLNPPITQEEAGAMGVETFNGWQHSCVKGVRYGAMKWTERPYGCVPGRGPTGS